MSDKCADINDVSLTSQQRLAALREYVKNGADFPAPSGEINNHIHTAYSFSPYTPAMAALKAKEAALEVAGSVDHDSIGAAAEMAAACRILGIGCVTGFEVRVSFKHTAFAGKKINNPDSPGLVYMTVQGVPATEIPRVEAFLKPRQEARHRRNRRMTAALNALLAEKKLFSIDYDRDVLPLSLSRDGGGVTERHLLYAFSLKLIEKYGKGEALVKTLKNTLGAPVSDKIAKLLTDETNPHYAYDLLGLLKGGFLERIFIQPDESECLPAETVTAFAASINAVPAYAYLGDVTDSPTGDKKAEKFEDDFLDDLFAALKSMGYLAVTYMPPRNTLAQLERVQKLCAQHGFLEISGVDINSSRQAFTCPELRNQAFAHLISTTWALAAHEKMAAAGSAFGLFSAKNPMAALPLAERTDIYARIGRSTAAVKEQGKPGLVNECGSIKNQL